MADDSHVIRGINWRETFPFTQVFRAFRVAIHPTKLILALAALLCIYLGGRVLDGLWPVEHKAVPPFVAAPAGGAVTDADIAAIIGRRPNALAVGAGSRGEVYEFEKFNAGLIPNYESFKKLRDDRRRQLEESYVRLLRDELKLENDEEAHKAARYGTGLSRVRDALVKQRDEEVKAAAAARDAQKKALESAEKGTRDTESRNADSNYDKAVLAAYDNAAFRYRTAAAITGDGIFIQFFSYEVEQVNNICWAVLANDWLGGFAGNPPTRFEQPDPQTRIPRPGVLASIKNFFVTGPWWLVRTHHWFALFFGILYSIVWAVFGGAICRIAAVHVARDEKISFSAALRFSTAKLLSFVFAPIIPLLIVLVVGAVVFLGGLVANIPGIGPVLVGLLFFLALAAGFVMTLVLLGTGGGFNLMYPTIAVEGSDSFDAISRSFSYVYARPWRMLFYTLIALVYGALCFLFVRLFIALMLKLTHGFVGAATFANVPGAPLDAWNLMWPSPTFHPLPYEIDRLNLSGPQYAGAILIAFWVYLTIGMLGAFAISFYFSANTIIYYLMRREVDATELDDVYLEQSEEDFADTATPPTSAPVAPATTSATTETAAPASPPPGT
jgi:hypothetical protein